MLYPRWYLMPEYQSVRVSADNLGMELVGQGVKVVCEDEVVGPNGQIQRSGHADKASHAFTDGFTRKYPELSKKIPCYAQLRNCIDMAIAACYIQQNNLYAQAGWNLDTFGDEKGYAVETFNSPLQIEPTVTTLWKNSRLFFPISGGVQIQPARALDSKNRLADEDGKIAETREGIDLKQLAADRWWWD